MFNTLKFKHVDLKYLLAAVKRIPHVHIPRKRKTSAMVNVSAKIFMLQFTLTTYTYITVSVLYLLLPLAANHKTTRDDTNWLMTMNLIFIGETADLNLPIDISWKIWWILTHRSWDFFLRFFLQIQKNIPTMVSNFVTISKHCHSSQIKTDSQIFPPTPPSLLLLLKPSPSLQNNLSCCMYNIVSTDPRTWSPLTRVRLTPNKNLVSY